jgi:hypothetical protein
VRSGGMHEAKPTESMVCQQCASTFAASNIARPLAGYSHLKAACCATPRAQSQDAECIQASETLQG